MIKDYFTFAFKSLRKRKLRSWLTVIGILIAVANIFLLISLSLGLQGAIQEQFDAFGVDKFFILPKGQFGPPGSSFDAVKLTVKDAERVEKVTGVKDISYFTAGNAEIQSDKEKRFVALLGYPIKKSEAIFNTGAYKIDEGSFLKDGDRGKVMLGSQYKNNNVFKKPLHAGDKIEINGKEFKIKSVLQPIGNPTDDRLIFLPLDELKEITSVGDRVDQIVVQVEKGQDVNAVAKRAEKSLRQFRNQDEKDQDFSIQTPEEILATLDTVLQIITGFLLGVAAISLIVGSIGIANTMYTSVIERTKEIGVMKAIGAKNSDIAILFLIESGLLGLVGGIIGVLLGIGIGKTIEYIAVNQLGTNLLKIAIPFYLVALCILFAFLVGAIAGTLPAIRASKVQPTEALRYE